MLVSLYVSFVTYPLLVSIILQSSTPRLVRGPEKMDTKETIEEKEGGRRQLTRHPMSRIINQH